MLELRFARVAAQLQLHFIARQGLNPLRHLQKDTIHPLDDSSCLNNPGDVEMTSNCGGMHAALLATLTGSEAKMAMEQWPRHTDAAIQAADPPTTPICEARDVALCHLQNSFKIPRRNILEPKWLRDMKSARKTSSLPPTKTLPVCDAHTAALCSPLQEIVRVNDFRLPHRLQELHLVPLGLLRRFRFARIRLDALGAKSYTTTAYR